MNGGIKMSMISLLQPFSRQENHSHLELDQVYKWAYLLS